MLQCRTCPSPRSNVNSSFVGPNAGNKRCRRNAAISIASHVPIDAHIGIVATRRRARSTLTGGVGGQCPAERDISNNGSDPALRRARCARQVFYLNRGFDTHASQDTIGDAGAYVRLMTSLNDG